MLPGRPLANLYFATFGYNSLYQAKNMLKVSGQHLSRSNGSCHLGPEAGTICASGAEVYICDAADWHNDWMLHVVHHDGANHHREEGYSSGNPGNKRVVWPTCPDPKLVCYDMGRASEQDVYSWSEVPDGCIWFRHWIIRTVSAVDCA